MKEAIAAANARIDFLRKETRLLEEFVSAYQKICTHELVDAPEFYNAHKGEEYQKCVICGVKI